MGRQACSTQIVCGSDLVFVKLNQNINKYQDEMLSSNGQHIQMTGGIPDSCSFPDADTC